MIDMDLHDYLNVRRVFRMLAAEWNCPTWAVKAIIREFIDRGWEDGMSDPEKKRRWEQYFPQGKPTPKQYILRLGHAKESGEEIPYLF